MEDGNCLLQVKSILGGRYQTKPSAPRDPASIKRLWESRRQDTRMGKKLAGPPSSPISDWSVYMLHIKDRCQGMPAFRGQGGTWACQFAQI